MTRKLLILALGVVWLGVIAGYAQRPTNGPGQTNVAPGFTNVFNNVSNSFGWGTNYWWTNLASVSNKPPPGRTNRQTPYFPASNSKQPNSQLPGDVQSIINQFQQQRNQLENVLNNMTQQQREAALQQLEALREQWQEQLQTISATLREQTLQMQGQFNNQFGPVTRGTGGSGSSGAGGGGGKPRTR
jgi:hypothetical protein